MAKLLPVASVADPPCLYRSSGSRRRPAILGDLVLDAEDPLTIQFWGDFIRYNIFFDGFDGEWWDFTELVRVRIWWIHSFDEYTRIKPNMVSDPIEILSIRATHLGPFRNQRDL